VNFPPPSKLFMAVFSWYARWLVRRTFAGLRVRGELAEPGSPVIYVVNHSAWWDAIVIFLLSRSERRMRHAAWMAESGLVRFPFFARLGALAVPDTRGTSAMRAFLLSVKRWMSESPGALWIFPQGSIRHSDVRPLGIAPGASRVARRFAPCRLVPVAIRYEFGEVQRPEIFVSIGRAHEVPAEAFAAPVSDLLERELARLKADLIDGSVDRFRTMIAGRDSVDARWERTKALLRPGGPGPVRRGMR
jgi:1-acyl-sn-glycerol-3-phosphate acyltransferase